jgi:trans-aconitate methyltransferase
MTNPKNHYTFGDSERAERRLSLLAQAYSARTRAFVERHSARGLDRAVDLGCGPGHTTRLVHEASGARRAIGIDRSHAYIEAARRNAPEELEFVCHDVLELPYPVPPAPLVFSRFLLTHLADPRDALTRFQNLVAPGGLLLLEETSALCPTNPVLARYYALVEGLQRHYGQALYIGRDLEPLARSTSLHVEHYADHRFEQSTAVMAELHALNVATWKDDAYARVAFDRAELDTLEQSLVEVAAQGVAAGTMEVGLGEIALRRLVLS